MVLLIIFCHLGWRFQRHWHSRFRKVVMDLLSSNLPLAPRTKGHYRMGAFGQAVEVAASD